MTTTPQTFQAQWPLAVQALGLHAQIHALPAPWIIDFRATEIAVSLPAGSADRWIDTVIVDAQHQEERAPAGVEAIRTEWDVRLPDTGFRFTFVTMTALPVWRPAVVSA